MSHRAFAGRLRGVLGFPATPMHDDLSLNLPALEPLVDRMASLPYGGLVAVGGLGEIYSLTPEENIEVVRRTVEVTARRMPVIAGVGFNAAIAAGMAGAMEKAGAEGLLVLPPYYTNAPAEGLLDYYEAVGQATSLPIGVYSRDWVQFTPDMVARLADRLPNFVYWKDGQGDIRRYQRIMNRVGERLAWLGGVGDDSVPAYCAIGVQGYTSSVSTIAPRLPLALWEAGASGDYATLNALLREYVHPLFAFRDRLRGYEVAAMKKGMALLGMRAGPVRPPLANVRPEEIETLRAIVERFRDYL